MTALLDARRFVVPRKCAAEVHAHLERVGRQGFEGMGLWVGVPEGDGFRVTEAVIPAQKHMRTADGVCVAVGPEELHRLNVWLFKRRLTLVAQIHSHPREAYHSGTDDAYAVATTAGSLSLVVPDFATKPFALGLCAVYRLDAKGRWREVRTRDAARLIEITE